MDDVIIKKHDFEQAKNEIKEFSEQTTTDLDLRKVDDSKSIGQVIGDFIRGRGFGLDHNVTGEELNEITSQIQKHLQCINTTQIKLIQEFGSVYNALDALDKDYIQAILVSINATKKTSESIQEAQTQIKKMVENQKKTIEKLNEFKHRLDGYAHLGDIDNIWDAYQQCYDEMEILSNSIENVIRNNNSNTEKIKILEENLKAIEKKVEAVFKILDEKGKKLESINMFTAQLEKISHLTEVDEMWKSISEIKDFISSSNDILDDLQKNTYENNETIDKLVDYKKYLSSVEHLKDVDDIWKEVKEHTSQFIDSENFQKELTDIIQNNRIKVEKKIENVVETTNSSIESLTKKIKYAFLVAGGSAILAVIELFLLVIKVI